MTDLEISKALALAIGWTENRLDKRGQPDPDIIHVGPFHEAPECIQCWDASTKEWCVFDYRDWNVIAQIAEKYNCFPMKSVIHPSQWCAVVNRYGNDNHYADTPQKAIALAVINEVKK